MKAASEPDFKQRYATHLKRLQLQGLQPKTISAYARAIRHLGAYFDDLAEEQQPTTSAISCYRIPGARSSIACMGSDSTTPMCCTSPVRPRI